MGQSETVENTVNYLKLDVELFDLCLGDSMLKTD